MPQDDQGEEPDQAPQPPEPTQEPTDPQEEDGQEEDDYEQHKPIRSPEGLDYIIKVTTPKAWIALWTVLGLIFFVFLWLIFGSIPIKIVGKGLVINREGLFDVAAQSDGAVKSIHVKLRQPVKKGDLIAELYDPQLDFKITAAEIRERSLADELDRLKKQIAVEGGFQKRAFESEKAAKEFTIKTVQARIRDLNDELSRKERLHKEGLIALTQVHQVQEQLYEAEVTLETTKANLATVISNLEKTYRFEELKSKEDDWIKAKQELGLLLVSQEYEKIYSPYDGEVLGLLVNVGDIVSKGTPLVWMEHLITREAREHSHLIYGFVPIEEGKRIQLGTPVDVELSNVNTQEYGALIGRVIEVSPFAVSPETVTKTIHNAGLASYLTAGEKATVMIVIQPEMDPKTFSGYKWTSGNGPPIKITTGTTVTIKAIVERIRPLYYLIPIWRIKYLNRSLQVEPSAEQPDVPFY